MKNKSMIIGLLAIVGILILIFINPVSWNDAGERIVVEQMDGDQYTQFAPGTFWSGFFSKETVWPNQISVSYQDTLADMDLQDGTIEIKKINVRFNDATTAYISGIVQYILPSDNQQMINMHNAHRTPQSLVGKRLSPYTKECLQSSAQLMSSEMHYGGGRAQMSQDFGDQLKNGVFLLSTEQIFVYDSLEKERKRVYQTYIQKSKDGSFRRKVSSIKEYGITVADAAITDVDYEEKVDNMLAKKIDASTKASISKQELMTAQQQALTAKAQGERELVTIEYKQKQEQTKQLVEAQTRVDMANKDKEQQRIQSEAAVYEAKKTKTLADAAAYEKRTTIMANGALEQKLEAWVAVNTEYAKAMTSSNWCPTTVIGNGGGGTPWANGNASALIELMMVKTAKDLNLEMKNK